MENKLDDGADDGRVHYGLVKFQGSEFRVGDSAFFHPEVFVFNAKPTVVRKAKQDRSMVKWCLFMYLMGDVTKQDRSMLKWCLFMYLMDDVMYCIEYLF